MKFYLKRAIFVLVVVVIGVVYSNWKDEQEAAAVDVSGDFALVVARLAVAEALHHDSKDSLSWFAVKDSMLASWGLTSDSVDNYVNSFVGHEEKLAGFWKRVRTKVDSLSDLELARLSEDKSQATDSVLEALDSASNVDSTEAN